MHDSSIVTLFFIPLALCWGSFLNMLGYRLVHDRSILTKRSQCPQCDAVIAWYDNIPVISWLLLRGRCRQCKKPISVLYPMIELLTLVVLYAVYTLVDHQFFVAYFLFTSALIITIRSDLETMLISRYVSLYAVPVGIACSALGLLPIGPIDSVAGTLFGYGLFWCIATAFYYITGKQGLGQGDIDLLAFIGSFTGIIGCWATMLIGSLVGSVVGIAALLCTQQGLQTRIPFGPFLALGAICYILLSQQIHALLLGC
jgi:leader peptidase (prepilin peptidase)/N-methyltransferase